LLIAIARKQPLPGNKDVNEMWLIKLTQSSPNLHALLLQGVALTPS
jgi:hypothetical protein